ncbi:MAG: Uncharacterised protein [Alphaproteobacteria bacterium UBA4588]|nr:MAG: Uncharacterised protein [Alphaproteobacteria bacterium UBA4588]
MKPLGIIFIILFCAGLAGVFFLSSWHIPAPTKTVTKIISDDRFK